MSWGKFILSLFPWQSDPLVRFNQIFIHQHHFPILHTPKNCAKSHFSEPQEMPVFSKSKKPTAFKSLSMERLKSGN
jgi:hypothetical protein